MKQQPPPKSSSGLPYQDIPLLWELVSPGFPCKLEIELHLGLSILTQYFKCILCYAVGPGCAAQWCVCQKPLLQSPAQEVGGKKSFVRNFSAPFVTSYKIAQIPSS